MSESIESARMTLDNTEVVALGTLSPEDAMRLIRDLAAYAADGKPIDLRVQTFTKTDWAPASGETTRQRGLALVVGGMTGQHFISVADSAVEPHDAR